VSSSESSLIIFKIPGICSIPFCPLLQPGPHSNTPILLLSATEFSVLSFSSSFDEPLTLAFGELSAVESLDLHSSIPLPTFVLSSSIIPILTFY